MIMDVWIGPASAQRVVHLSLNVKPLSKIMVASLVHRHITLKLAAWT